MNNLFTKIGIALSLFTTIPVSFNSTSAIGIRPSIQETINQTTIQQEDEENIIDRRSWSGNTHIKYSAIIYSNNSVYVKCQSSGTDTKKNNDFGTISFNDNIYECIVNSKYNDELKHIDSYVDSDKISYDFIYNDNQSCYLSGDIFEFTLLPKSDIDKNIKETVIDVFGQRIILNNGELNFSKLNPDNESTIITLIAIIVVIVLIIIKFLF